MARPASKAFLRALAESRLPRCKANAHGDTPCEKHEGHKGRHRAIITGGMTMKWTDKKAALHKGTEKEESK